MSRPEYLNYRITEQRRTRLDALASLTHSTSDADTLDAALTIALKERNMNTKGRYEMNADRAKEIWSRNVGGAGTDPNDFISNGKIDEASVAAQLDLVRGWAEETDEDAESTEDLVAEVREAIETLVELELERADIEPVD